jgi:hypothetical protein
VELLSEMVSYRQNATGIDNTVFISPKGQPRRSPGIKVAIDPPDSLNPSAGAVSIAIHDGSAVAGSNLPSALLRQLQQFIDANRPVLLDYREYRIDTGELRQRPKKI